MAGAALVSLALSGCTGAPKLSSEEKARLAKLEAMDVVFAYFGSGDQSVESYLQTADYTRLHSGSNAVSDNERRYGVDNLTVRSLDASRTSSPSDNHEFIVEYVSHRTNNIGEPPGKRIFFVIVQRSPEGR